ncbi:uncharacterized protein G2W53_027865 [Senna tora]|uniref:Uncharacterized protein n=1 Tax=Senna tora TaxID=362788 RepID=A0A834WGE9_9FABA|nr:uncharacterized protein G2W53_027865 [Senna tora]
MGIDQIVRQKRGTKREPYAFNMNGHSDPTAVNA